MGIWLHREEYEKLVHAYVLSIKSIKQLFKDTNVSQWFLDVFKYQYDHFYLLDDPILERTVRNPWTLVPIYDEKYQDKIPEVLKTSETPIEQVKDQIQRLLSLGYLINKLSPSGKVCIFEDYPFKFESRDVHTWNKEDTIVVDEDKTLVLWNQIEGKNIYTRYIILDTEFFILAEPSFDEGPFKTVKIKMKYSLKNIMITKDSKNSWKLTVGVYEYDHNGEWKYSYFPIAFENSLNLNAVRKTIEGNQKQQNQFIDTQVHSFLDFCEDSIVSSLTE